jgi:hypothetical protein
MRIVLEATRAEYVAWLGQQPVDRVFETSDTGNPLSAFLLEYVIENCGVRSYDWIYPLRLMTYLRQERDGSWHCAVMIEHEAHDEYHHNVEIAVTLPAWMQPLATRYQQSAPVRTFTPAGAIADAEALPAETGA